MPAPPLAAALLDPPGRGLGTAPTLADGWGYNADAYRRFVAQELAKGVAAGTHDPATGWPTQAGYADAAHQAMSALLMGTTAPGIRAFHGTPHSFDKFDLSKIGTGEGAQVYGHGLYFAEKEAIAKSYRDTLSGRQPNPDYDALASVYKGHMNELDNLHMKMVDESRKTGTLLDDNDGWGDFSAKPTKEVLDKYKDQWDGIVAKVNQARDAMSAVPSHINNPGSMYEVALKAEPEHFLDWDKPLAEQSPHVQQALGWTPPPTWAAASDLTERLRAQGVPPEETYMHPEWRALNKQLDDSQMLYGAPFDRNATGADVYHHVFSILRNRALGEYPGATKGYPPPEGFNPSTEATKQLQESGIAGIRYLDGTSRRGVQDYQESLANAGDNIDYLNAQLKAARAKTQQYQPGTPEHDAATQDTLDYQGSVEKAQGWLKQLQDNPVKATSNYVMFNPDQIEIARKYAVPGMVAGGAAAAAANQTDAGQDTQ